jgi:hypothetical protein
VLQHLKIGQEQTKKNPKHDFTNSFNTPNVEEIEKHLSKNGLSPVVHDEIVI